LTFITFENKILTDYNKLLYFLKTMIQQNKIRLDIYGIFKVGGWGGGQINPPNNLLPKSKSLFFMNSR